MVLLTTGRSAHRPRYLKPDVRNTEGESRVSLIHDSSSAALLLPGLELSHTKVYAPQIRGLLGTSSHFCEVVVLELRSLPIGTALSFRNLRDLSRSRPGSGLGLGGKGKGRRVYHWSHNFESGTDSQVHSLNY